MTVMFNKKLDSKKVTDSITAIYGKLGEIEQTREFKKIIIDKLDYGYVIKIGCQSFAIESEKKVLSGLTTYLNNPSEEEKRWFKEKTI